MKVVINTCFGGFGLSNKAMKLYLQKKGINQEYYYDNNIPRDDPILIEVVEELKTESGTSYADLKVVQIPDEVDWEICEYDGSEWVAEVHRTWR